MKMTAAQQAENFKLRLQIARLNEVAQELFESSKQNPDELLAGAERDMSRDAHIIKNYLQLKLDGEL